MRIGKYILILAAFSLIFFLPFVSANTEQKVVSLPVSIEVDYEENSSSVFLHLFTDQSSHEWTVIPGNHSEEFTFFTIADLECNVESLTSYAQNISELCLKDRERLLEECRDDEGVAYQAKYIGCNERSSVIDQQLNDSKVYESDYNTCNSELNSKNFELSDCKSDRDDFKVQRFFFAIGAALLIFGGLWFKKIKQLPDHGVDTEFPDSSRNIPDLPE